MFAHAVKWALLFALQQLASAESPSAPPSPGAPPPSSPPSSPGGLETGVLVGIIVGSVVGAILLVYLIYGLYVGMKMGGTFSADPLMVFGDGALIGSRAPGAEGKPFTATIVAPATVDMGVPQKSGAPGLYAVVSGDRWFWSAGNAK